MPTPTPSFNELDFDAAGMATWRHPYPGDATELESVIHPDDLDGMWHLLQRAGDPAGDGRFHAEYRVRRGHGGWRWVSAWATVEFDRDLRPPRPAWIAGVSLDITVRKRNELLLAAQKQSLELIVGGAPLETVLTHLTTVAEQHADGDSVASILLLDKDGLLHHGASTQLPANYLAAIEGLRASPELGTCSVAASTGKVVITPDFDTDPKWAALKHWPLSLGLKGAWSRPIIARDGRVLGTFGTYFREVRGPSPVEMQAVEILSHTAALAIERAQDERALRESERKLQTLVANLPGMAYSCPTVEPWPLTYASEGVFELTGYSAADFMEQRLTWQQIIHPDDLEMVGSEVGAALEARRPFEVAYRIIDAGGATRWILDRGRGIVDPATNEVVAIEGFAGDLTRQHEAEDALREADRRKDEFIATLSHELRNPLSPLRTALHLLHAGDVEGEASRRLFATMERQVDHLVRLVDDLLEVSRISRGTLELRKEPVDLIAVIRMAVETTEPAIAAAGHQLRQRLPDRPLFVDGDAVRLSQILANLLNNAAKYMDDGGTIELTASAEGGEAIVAVRDRGAGIEPAVLPQLFQMFVRVDTSHGRHRGGLGIGLALARRLAEMHGGTLTAFSEGAGKGSTFTLRIPLIDVEPHTAAAAPPPSAAASAPLRHRVLVCDDNADAADMTALWLEQLGAEAHTAYDGTSALREAERLQPDVMLLDIGMPDRDGHDVCREIRRHAWGQAILMVAVTGWGQQRDQRESAAAGFDHHLVKPVAPDALAELLRSLPPRK